MGEGGGVEDVTQTPAKGYSYGRLFVYIDA